MKQGNSGYIDNALYIATVCLAYKIGNNKQFNEAKDILDNTVLRDTGWEVFAHSREYSASIGRNLKAVALINPETKEICIANAGTTINFFDLLDDIKLAIFDSLPTKLSRMKAFMQEVGREFSELYNIDPNEIQWKFTGHSLGGVLADLEAAEAIRAGKHVTQVVTYDNPGSLPLIESNHLLYDKDIENLSKITTSYVAAKNIINRTNEQLSNDIQLVVPKEELVEEATNANSSGGWGSFFSSAFHKVTDVASAAIHKVAHATCYALDKIVKKPLDSIGLSYYTAKIVNTADDLGDWSQDITRIGGHGLANFKALSQYSPDSDNNEVEVIKIENWNKHQPIVRVSELNKLGNTSTGNDVVLLDTIDLDGEDSEFVLVDQYERSYADLAKARANNYSSFSTDDTVVTSDKVALLTETPKQKIGHMFNQLTDYVEDPISHASNYINTRLNIVKSNLEPIIEEGIETVAHYFNKQVNNNGSVQYYANNNFSGEPCVVISTQTNALNEDTVLLSGLFENDITC